MESESLGPGPRRLGVSFTFAASLVFIKICDNHFLQSRSWQQEKAIIEHCGETDSLTFQQALDALTGEAQWVECRPAKPKGQQVWEAEVITRPTLYRGGRRLRVVQRHSPNHRTIGKLHTGMNQGLLIIDLVFFPLPVKGARAFRSSLDCRDSS